MGSAGRRCWLGGGSQAVKGSVELSLSVLEGTVYVFLELQQNQVFVTSKKIKSSDCATIFLRELQTLFDCQAILLLMQIQEKNSLTIINDNHHMLQKLPEILSKHLECYENMHRDIDPTDQLSISHYRSRQGSTQSHAKQFVTVSAEFVELISRLRTNFVTLSKKHVSQPSFKEKTRWIDVQNKKLSNFDLFVSEHCQNSGRQILKRSSTPQIPEYDFSKFLG